MKPYILKVGHIGLISEGKYAAHIAIMDSDTHCFTGIAYKTIVVDAINEEFARKIADIRIEEMMINNESEIDSIYDKNILIETKRNYSKKYAELVAEMDQLRTKHENLLTAIVKNAQQDAEYGINIEEMGIHVQLDGNYPELVVAVRVEKSEGDDYLELNIGTYSEPDWYSIYDFYSGTAGTILCEIMENL
jgi:hypothetical protein